ncbi:MAG: methionine--tRNA ligase [Sulfolobales archaeon]|nr:methionine--tRNA ligase [Sulfolobales archaeon]MCX8185643.1 methionine--tRNA ligase [Sulfolobales archaeon]MDW7969586.1 methionine--tRNA ligase [Sulfolobales archaeon]
MRFNKWVVTSAWPYINTVPHLGNMIGSVLSADVFARYLRLRGCDVVLVSGSDEHGTVIEVEARRKGIEPQKLTDDAHEYVSKLFRAWGISYDNYTRTESEVHKEFVSDLMLKIYERGFIDIREQIIPFCDFDRIYLPDRFVVGTCPHCGYEDARGDQCDSCGSLLNPEELISPKCVFCHNKPVFKTTKHWFFRLDKIEDLVKDWLEKHEYLDGNVRSYATSWIKMGLKPRSITRDNKWGIKAPFPGADEKTIYVWFEALLGYVSATIELFKMRGLEDKWHEYWFNKESGTAYFIGKDNIPFHAIILPAMLLASGEGYNLPTLISSTEYLMFEGQKFSKSRRVGIWIDEALEILPDPDYWRFTLIRMRPEERDTNFSWAEFMRVVNSELNDDIGNYIHRVLTFINRFYNGVVPTASKYSTIDYEFRDKIASSLRSYCQHMDFAKMKAASDVILELARAGNQYLNTKEPWTKVKTDKEDASTTLYLGFISVYALGLMLFPIIPNTAMRIFRVLNQDVNGIKLNCDESLLNIPPCKVGKPEPLFKKLDTNFLQNVDAIIAEARRKAQSKRPDVLKW